MNSGRKLRTNSWGAGLLRPFAMRPNREGGTRPSLPSRILTPIFATAAAFVGLVACQASGPETLDSPENVLAVMQRVADWQLAHPSTHDMTDWTQGVLDTGMMALAGISNRVKYRDAMVSTGDANKWQPGPRMYHADDHCVGQAYAELYLLYRDARMLQPLRTRFDAILARPAGLTSLDFSLPRASDEWSWCDALFMGPPTWARLYSATGDKRYLDFALEQWWKTTAYLYDKDEHLYFRDSTYFQRREANGAKVFWSRGNGWVFAGLVRVLQYLPAGHPDRPRLEAMFREMSARLLSCQQPDSLWHSSLLDPSHFPIPETSGSSLLIYGLAWGINQGLLDRAAVEPAVRRGWAALVRCVDDDGRLTHVQPIGSNPRSFDPESTEIYGVGAFLLAGSEVYRIGVLSRAKSLVVRVANPAAIRRETETIELDLHDAAFTASRGPSAGSGWAVMNGCSSQILDSQCYASQPGTEPEKLLFQADLAPGETRLFRLVPISALAATPPPIAKAFARFVPERFDDVAWENDRIAFRMYGMALIKAEGTISSGIDVWVKRTRRLVVDDMYKSGRYHDDNGEEMDDYRVGPSRGCGGIGVWDGQKLHVSSNYRSGRIIASGPIRAEFELSYDAWDAGNGRKVTETKRISLDAGSNLNFIRSVFSSDDPSPLTVAVGLSQRPGDGPVSEDRNEGWITYWQPADGTKGTMAVLLLLPKDTVAQFTNDAPGMTQAELHVPVQLPTLEGAPPLRNMLAVATAKIGTPFPYFAGACWDRSGDFPTPADWVAYARLRAERRDHPVVIAIGE